ncbi:lanthionine synthetase C family protein [Streptosporangium sandarakinum]|uniref:lanthionine synthetase C family protein n=1 Tax=Streptosporangium sandarakinum TaxID=1260955 RepID=UPI0037B2CD4E
MKPGPVHLTTDEATCQSLANGTAGAALLHIERALTGAGDWRNAHELIRQAIAARIDSAPHTGLYYGAPALVFMLHAAGTDGHPGYRSAATTLDTYVLRSIRRRLTAAASRMERGHSTTFSEYDVFYGLTGLGALLLRRAPGSDTLADVLRYVIRLIEPRHEDGDELPGWWVDHDPDPLMPTPGGHANLGMAHGAAGLLALLALATLRGCVVDGQHQALEYLTAWFDRWRQESADGPWWPQWVTREDLRTSRPAQHGPGRPSWCYGAAGIARAQQLAALAAGDPPRRQAAEEALAACLTGRQLRRITDAGLCHGMAGVYQSAYRAARDAQSTAIAQRLPALAEALTRTAAEGDEAGLLTGVAGVGLALETTRHITPPRSGWDACLLIT